jgi:hypothetical protein
MQRQQLRNLQGNKLMQWGMLFLVVGIAIRLVVYLGAILFPFAGWAVAAGIILLVVGLIRGK